MRGMGKRWSVNTMENMNSKHKVIVYGFLSENKSGPTSAFTFAKS